HQPAEEEWRDELHLRTRRPQRSGDALAERWMRGAEQRGPAWRGALDEIDVAEPVQRGRELPWARGERAREAVCLALQRARPGGGDGQQRERVRLAGEHEQRERRAVGERGACNTREQPRTGQSPQAGPNNRDRDLDRYQARDVAERMVPELVRHDPIHLV